MAVTFPLILFSIDYLKGRSDWRHQLIEKVPFFTLSLAFGTLATFAQQKSSALIGAREIDFVESVFVAGYGLLTYLIKAVFPFHLSGFHPYPVLMGELLPWYYFAASIAVFMLFFLFLRYFRSNRQLVFGLAFFVFSIAPVLQFLPVGLAVYAERYTYLAYIGLFYIIALGIFAFKNVRFKFIAANNRMIFVSVALYICLLGTITFQRSDVWENGEALWTDVIKKYPSDFFAYAARASLYTQTGNIDHALTDYNESVRLLPVFF